MFEQAFRNIDDVLWKEAGCITELDYTEQTSWLLFLQRCRAIPGEGTLLKGAQLGGGVISAVRATAGNSPASAGLAGAGVGLSAADGTANITANVFGKSVKVIPFLGNLLSAYSAYRDFKEMGAYYDDCMAGKN